MYLLNPWWEGKEFSKGIERKAYLDNLQKHIKDNLVGILVGSRRVGKTTILFQLINALLKDGIEPRRILYVLLDHPKFSKYTISQIIEDYRRLHDLSRDVRIFLFFDEAQYTKGWEQEIKALADTEKVKIFVSGSASTLIFQKQAFLTGRFFKQAVFPLDFAEFLIFKGKNIPGSENYRLENLLEDYFRTGGYPEYVLQQNPEYFADLAEAIVFKDIVLLFGIRNPQLVRDLLLLLADRAGHQTSFTKLGKILSLSTETVREYVSCLEQTFLITELRRFAASRNKQIYAAKKFYLNDTGLLFNLVGKLSVGSSAEQVLFHYLSRKNKKIFFYYEEKQEVDFVIEGEEGKELIESKYMVDLDKEKIEKQLLGVAKNLKGKRIKIVTKREQQKFKLDGLNIEYIPLWKILLEK